MKIKELTARDVAGYLRLPEGGYTETELKIIMDAALRYVTGYTGLPAEAADGGETVNDYDDLTIAWLVLCQDMYDRRTAEADTAAVNRTLDTILGLHGRNLCG